MENFSGYVALQVGEDISVLAPSCAQAIWLQEAKLSSKLFSYLIDVKIQLLLKKNSSQSNFIFHHQKQKLPLRKNRLLNIIFRQSIIQINKFFLKTELREKNRQQFIFFPFYIRYIHMEGYISASSYRHSYHLPSFQSADVNSSNAQSEIDKISIQLLEQYYEYRRHLINILKGTDASAEQVKKIQMRRPTLDQQLYKYGVSKQSEFKSGERKEKQRLKLASKLIQKRKKHLRDNRVFQQKYEQEELAHFKVLHEQADHSRVQIDQPIDEITETQKRFQNFQHPKLSERIGVDTSLQFMDGEGNSIQKKGDFSQFDGTDIGKSIKKSARVIKHSMTKKSANPSMLKKSQFIKTENQYFPFSGNKNEEQKETPPERNLFHTHYDETFSPYFPKVNKNSVIIVSQGQKRRSENQMKKISSKSLKRNGESDQGMLNFVDQEEEDHNDMLIQNQKPVKDTASEYRRSTKQKKGKRQFDTQSQMLGKSTYMDLHNETVQLQQSKVLMISQRVENTLKKGNSPQEETSSISEDSESSELIQEKQNTIQQTYIKNIQRMLSQLCNLFSLSQCFKYLLKNKQYEIFTKLYKLADEKGIDEVNLLSIQVLKKGMSIILAKEDKIKVNHLLDKMFSSFKKQISYEDFGYMFKAVINEYQFKWFNNKKLDLDPSRTVQFLRRLLIIYLQIDYFERKMRKLMKINSGYISLLKQKITPSDDPDTISLDKLQNFIFQTVQNRVNRRKIELYFQQHFKLQKVQEFINWVYSLK